MRTNKIGKIAVGVDGHKQSSFDLSHDVETTMNMGEVSPLFVKEMKPHSKMSMRKEDLLLTAPFNTFTYGRLDYETLSMFVDEHKIFPRLDSFLSGEATSCSNDLVGDVSVPVCRPSTCAGVLASFKIIGDKVNFWHSALPVTDSYDGEDLKAMGSTQGGSTGGIGNYWVFDPASVSAPTSHMNSMSSYLSAKGIISGSIATTPTVSPNLRTAYMKGRKAYFWVNLSKLNYEIQKAGISRFNEAQTASYPQGMTNVWEEIRKYNANSCLWVPLSNTMQNAFGAYEVVSGGAKRWVDPLHVGSNVTDPPEVITPEGADFIIPFHYTHNGNTYLGAACFKMCDASKRFYGLLKGLEMPTDIGCTRFVNCERLLAYYMAYYEAFGIQTNISKVNSPFARLLDVMSTHISRTLVNQNNDDDYRDLSTRMLLTDSTADQNWGVNRNHCTPFVLSLFDMWLTDANDFASIHTNSTIGNVSEDGELPHSISELNDILHRPAFGLSTGQFVDSAGSLMQDNDAIPSISSVIAGSASSGLALQMPSAIHNIRDARLLLKMAKWSNRFAVTGHDIEKQLEVLGYGHALDLFGARFIGKTTNRLDISQVPSLADTFNEVDGTGKELGEIGAKSVNYDKSQRFTYESDNGGYWVTMAYIRPVSGYGQSVDCEVYDCERSETFIPEFDGEGHEYTPMSQFFNTSRFESVGGCLTDSSQETFGLVPRDSHRKVTRDVLNRGFSLASVRNTYAPYHLHRFTPLGDFTKVIYDSNKLATFEPWNIGTDTPVTLQDLPRCGVWSRMPYAYEWLCQLERIFSRSRIDNYEVDGETNSFGSFLTNFHLFGDDNFIVHTSLDVDYKAPMRPIEVTYETYDPEKGANGAMSKS